MAKKSEIKARVEKYKNLPQYKNKTEEELFELAKKSLEKDDKKGLNKDLFLKNEQKKAKELFNNYIDEYHLESPSDIDLLNELIYFKVLRERLQKQINEYTEKNLAPNKGFLNSLLDISKQEMELTEKLGLFADKEKDTASVWELTKKKALKYINENKGAFYFQCPGCGKMTLLMRKVENYEAFEWKMFEGTFVYNEKLFSMIHDKRMTEDEVAEVFGCSVDYIKGIYNKLFLKKLREAK